MFYVGAGVVPLIVLGVGTIGTFTIPSLIKWGIKRNTYKKAGLKIRNIIGKDILSSFIFLISTILICVLLSVFSITNYLIPILCFLLSYLIIDKHELKKINADSIQMFFVTLFSKIPVFLLCYYIIFLFFVPRYY